MQTKKKSQNAAAVRTTEDAKPARPVGMQAMGPTLYEHLRRILVELKLVSEN